MTKSPVESAPPGTPGGHDHDHDEAEVHQHALAEVEEGQRVVGLHRRLGIGAHGDVVAGGLALLGGEVLDRLVVEERVDGLLVGGGVLVVHLLADLHAPFGDREREPDVERDGGGHDGEIPGVEEPP
jgi:hypothetical protein